MIRISHHQTTLLLIVTVVATSIILLPGIVIKKAGPDAWLTGIILIGFSMLISIIYILLIKRMGKMDFITFNQKTLGKFLALPLGINLLVYFIMLSGIVTRETTEIMKAAYMPLTPLWFFNSTMIFVAAIIVYYGLEVMARSLEILFYLFLIFFLLLFILLSKDYSLEGLKPILGQGITPIIKSTYPALIFFSEFFIILIFSPNIREKSKIYRPLLLAIIISGLVFILAVIMPLMLFGKDLTDELYLPLVTANSYVDVFYVLERLDPFFIFYWIGGGLFKTAVFLYGAVYTGEKISGISKKILIPFFIIPIFYFSFYYFQNLPQINNFVTESVPYFVGVQVLYPLILLIISIIRGKNYAENG